MAGVEGFQATQGAEFFRQSCQPVVCNDQHLDVRQARDFRGDGCQLVAIEIEGLRRLAIPDFARNYGELAVAQVQLVTCAVFFRGLRNGCS